MADVEAPDETAVVAEAQPPVPRAAPPTDGLQEATASSDLGVKVRGSAREGHKVVGTHKTLQIIFGTEEPYQVNALLSHCLKVLNGNEAGDHNEATDERTFMLSAVKDIGPRDAVERMLAVQMTATHVALIRAGGWLAKADNLPRLEAYSTAYNKLARTYAVQVEALRKHRSGGQQKVTVEHVHVHSGGQAIVGDVHHGGGGWRMKGDVNPISRAHEAMRCTAHSKRTGEQCRAAAVSGWQVCYHHGAGGGHAAGPSHPRWVHGMRSHGAVEMRRLVNEVARETRSLEALIGGSGGGFL